MLRQCLFVCLYEVVCRTLLMRSSICVVASDFDVSDPVCLTHRSMALTLHRFMGIALTLHRFMGIAQACVGIPMMMSSSRNRWP